MCGIFCFICLQSKSYELKNKYESLKSKLKNRGPDAADSCEILLPNGYVAFFAGFVLWTQGRSVENQPICDSNKILLWNGDVYAGLHKGANIESDSRLIFESMKSGVDETVTQICGPYAFVHWDGNQLSFGRDPLGRHSLVWRFDKDFLVLSSVGSYESDWSEVPALGIFSIDLNSHLDVTLKPWSHLNVTTEDVKDLELKLSKPIEHFILRDIEFIEFNDNSYESQLKSLLELKNYKEPESIYPTLLKDENWINLLNELISLLEESVSLRTTVLPPYCRLCLSEKRNCHHAKIGVLFSGGLDSTILALLSDKYVNQSDPIDLYNVAFERETGSGFNVPDRVTGLKSLIELQMLAPQRKWNFVEINIDKEELIDKRSSWINDLIYPLKSVLDESLGCALWFAARGKGTINQLPYQSTARVVLVGMGADEMMGGYRKARRAFKEGEWIGLSAELNKGLREIPSRNLGRDNRVISDHSIVPRTPYLHEPLVSFLANLPPWKRCYLGDDIPQGIGDKLILRLAAWKLGLRGSAGFPKRAIQFGSRIANPKEQGHLTSNRLIKKHNQDAVTS